MVRKAPLAPSVPWPLALLTGAVGLLVLAPIGILVYQSLLTAPFFAPAKRFAPRPTATSSTTLTSSRP